MLLDVTDRLIDKDGKVVAEVIGRQVHWPDTTPEEEERLTKIIMDIATKPDSPANQEWVKNYGDWLISCPKFEIVCECGNKMIYGEEGPGDACIVDQETGGTNAIPFCGPAECSAVVHLCTKCNWPLVIIVYDEARDLENAIFMDRAMCLDFKVEPKSIE